VNSTRYQAKEAFQPQRRAGMLRAMSVSTVGQQEKTITRAEMIMPVYVPTFLLSFAQGMLTPILPIFAKSFGVSFSLASLAVAAAGIGTLIADVPVGMILVQLGRRRAMFIGVWMAATTTLIVALTHNYPMLVACRLVEGVGTALWGLSRHAYITDIAPRAQRGKFIASFGGINRIGTFGGPILGGTIGDLFGLTAPFYLAAAMSAAAGLIAFIYVKETGSRTGVATTRGHLRWKSVGKLMKTHRADLASAGAAQIFVAMIRSGRQLIIPLVGAYALNLSSGQIGLILTGAAMIDMALFIPAGWVMDRFGRKMASVPSFAIMAFGMLLIPVAHGFIGLFAAAAVIGFGNGIGSGTMMTLGADLAPPDAIGEFLGLWRFIGDAGQAGGPIVVGVAADALGLTATAFVLAGIGVVAAAILAILVRETLQTEPHPEPKTRAP
jgi:MFS family permease